jgi:hypothetical protein
MLHYRSSQQQRPLTRAELAAQNRRFLGTGGRSQENRSLGFRPAFLDSSTGTIHLARFADGRIAPMHLLEGLPAELVTARSASGRVTAVSEVLIAGFERDGLFYTRAQAAAAQAAEIRPH